MVWESWTEWRRAVCMLGVFFIWVVVVLLFAWLAQKVVRMPSLYQVVVANWVWCCCKKAVWRKSEV